MGFLKKIAQVFYTLDGGKKGSNGKKRIGADPVSDDVWEEKQEQHEANIRAINEKLTNQLSEIAQIEKQLKELLASYDNASAAAKEIYKIQILSLKKELDDLKEMRDVYERRLAKEKLILRKIKIGRETASHSEDIDEIQKLEEEAVEHLAGLEQEDHYLDELSRVQYRPKSKAAKGAEKEKETGSRIPNEAETEIKALRADLTPEAKAQIGKHEKDSEIEKIKQQLVQ